MSNLKFVALFAVGLAFSGALAAPANAETVTYTFTFTSTTGGVTGGMGTLTLNVPASFFTDSSFQIGANNADFTSLTATVDGLPQFSFLSSEINSLQFDNDGTFVSISATSPYVTDGSKQVQLELGGPPAYQLLVQNNSPLGGGNFSVGAAQIVTPLPPTWSMMLIGFAVLGFAGYYQAKRSASPVFAA